MNQNQNSKVHLQGCLLTESHENKSWKNIYCETLISQKLLIITLSLH